MSYLYHATKLDNLSSIIEEGLKPGMDGCIYFCTKDQHAINWVDMGNIDGEDILLVKVAIDDLDESSIEDGMDHDPNFFRGITVKTYDKIIPFHILDDNLMKYVSKHNPKYYTFNELKGGN